MSIVSYSLLGKGCIKLYICNDDHPRCSIQSLLPLTHRSRSGVVFKLAFWYMPEYIKCCLSKNVHRWTFHWFQLSYLKILHKIIFTFWLELSVVLSSRFVEGLFQFLLKLEVFLAFILLWHLIIIIKLFPNKVLSNLLLS